MAGKKGSGGTTTPAGSWEGMISTDSSNDFMPSSAVRLALSSPHAWEATMAEGAHKVQAGKGAGEIEMQRPHGM